MPKTFRVVIVIFGMAAGLGQKHSAFEVKDKQQFPGPRADMLYLSEGSTVQTEFGTSGTVRPNITLVLGAEKNEVQFNVREARFTD